MNQKYSRDPKLLQNVKVGGGERWDKVGEGGAMCTVESATMKPINLKKEKKKKSNHANILGKSFENKSLKFQVQKYLKRKARNYPFLWAPGHPGCPEGTVVS